MFVFCVGMFRSCSTWQYEVANELVTKHRGGEALGFVPGDQLEKLEAEPSERWRVLKAHDPHERFARTLAEGRALAVYSYRDIRDVAYSHMYKFGITFAEFMAQGWLARILESDRAWRAQPHIVCQRYEEIVVDQATAIRQIAAHLGLEQKLDPGEVERLAGEYSFQANFERTRAISERYRAEQVDLADPANVRKYDQKTLLHWNHMRDGRVGGWRQQASADERQTLAHHCAVWLIENGYECDDGWATKPSALRPTA